MTTSPDYAKMFDQFFKHGQMFSTCKTTLLYALTDIGLYDDGGLIGRHWIKQDGNFVTLKLDFLAIRFARYYWEILDSGIRHVPKAWAEKRGDINIFEILRNEKKSTVPTLKEIASDSMSSFRKKIIRYSIKQEILENLLKGESKNLYRKNLHKDSISIDKNMVYFMKNNMKQIKSDLRTKMENYLKIQNPGVETFEDGRIRISRDSPFYAYIRNHTPSLFLICIENDSLKQNYEKSCRRKINPEDYGIAKSVYGDLVSVWGLSSTDENKQVWEQIKRNDHVLFSQYNRCFSHGVIRGTVRNAKIAVKLWGSGKDWAPRDLLILIDAITSVEFDLGSSPAWLVDPTMPAEYNFPITRVTDQRVDYLLAVFGSIGTAFNSLDEADPDIRKLIPSDIKVVLEKHQLTVRRGQDKFRSMVLQNYHFKCAVCDMGEVDLLEASHIVPVGHWETSGSADNGICLCVLHHKMFDNGYLSFDDDYCVLLSEKACSSEQLVNSCKLPNRITHCDVLPSKDHLEIHRLNLKHIS